MKCPKCQNNISLSSVLVISFWPNKWEKCLNCKTNYRRIVDRKPKLILYLGVIGLALFFFITQVLVDIPLYGKILFVILWGLIIVIIDASTIELLSLDDE
jgi:hypothetical protein